MEFRRPDWTDGSRVWAAWPLGPLGDEGPLWIHSAEHAHRARCERGGSLVRQAPGHRSCLEPPQTLEPFPLNSPSAAPQPPTPFLSFLYISSELAVAVQSLVNDALLLLTTLQFLDYTRSTVVWI